MAKHKLKQFSEFESFENTFSFAEEQKGKWHTYFGNENPIVLELACGKGEYTLGLAEIYPEKNFIGVDIKGNRMWRGAKTALENKLSNVAFLRTQIERIEDYFAAGEVSEIWITFADPQPRESKEKKRLTHPLFLNKYRRIGVPGIYLNLKTDSDLLYAFTLEVIESLKLDKEVDHPNIYQWTDRPEALNIQTYYEKRWLLEGISIKYVRFNLSNLLTKELS